MRRLPAVSLPVVVLLGALLAGCATRPPSAEVTRFHLGQPIPSDVVTIVPGPGMDGASLEFRSHAAVVARELDAVGLRTAAGRNAYLGILVVAQTVRPGPPKPAPFRIGIGGGTIGNVGVGGTVSMPLGQPRTGDVRVNLVSLQLKRQSDETTIWEGRAVEEIAADAPASSLSASLPALAHALLAGFPGVSGQTVTVRLK